MDLNTIKYLITENKALLLYFYNDGCAPCKALRPKVQELIESEFPEMNFQLINAVKFPSTAAEYGVFSSPTILVFFENKEYIREGKNLSIRELREKIARIFKIAY